MEALRDRTGQESFTSAWARRFAFDHCFDSSSDPDGARHHDDQNSVFEALGTRVRRAAGKGTQSGVVGSLGPRQHPETSQ